MYKYEVVQISGEKVLKCPNIRINMVRYDKCGATPRFLQI